MSNESSNAIKVIALSAASLALLSACGEPTATPICRKFRRKRAIAGRKFEEQR